MTPGELGERLRRAGLTERALLAWAGTARISGLWRVVPQLARRPVPPAASALALFVAGADVSIDRLPAAVVDALASAQLVAFAGEQLRARVAILPLEHTLLVADRLDADDAEDLVCWPDDSSYHLASAIAAGRRDHWRDLATGSAFAPLARPALAAQITGIDLNPRAVAFARLGAALSGCAHVTIETGDVAHPGAPAALVTCNAPIIADPDRAIWRRTDQSFFDRLWTAAPRHTGPGGEVIVHAVLEAVPDTLPGEVATVVYTPVGERAYAVTWWRPDAPAHRARGRRVLTAARPHLDPRDRDDVLAGALPPVGDAAV